MQNIYLLLCLLFPFTLAAQDFKAEPHTTSSGVEIMIYPDGNTVKKVNYDRARELIKEVRDLFNAKSFVQMKTKAERAAALDPYYWDTYSHIALYYSGQEQNYQEALKYVDKALTLTTPKAFLLRNKGLFHRKLRQFREALDAYERSLKIYDKSAKAFFGVAYCSAKVGEDQDAVNNYTKAIQFKHADLDVCYNNRGVAYEKLKQYDLAREDYLMALKIRPDYQTAKNNLADLDEIAPSRPGTVWIIAVGVNNYQNDFLLSDLSFPSSSAYEFVRIFETRNLLLERARILINGQAKRSNIIRELKALNQSGKVSSNDLVLFYFSGHGEMAGRKMGICPFNYAGAQDLISDQEIADLLNVLPARHKVAIIESCKTNTETAAPVSADQLARFNRTRKALSGGLAYITSTGAGKESYGNREQGGFFTSHLRRALDSTAADTNGDNTVTLQEMFDYVKRETSKQTNGLQVPEMNTTGFDKSMPIMLLN